MLNPEMTKRVLLIPAVCVPLVLGLLCWFQPWHQDPLTVTVRTRQLLEQNGWKVLEVYYFRDGKFYKAIAAKNGCKVYGNISVNFFFSQVNNVSVQPLASPNSEVEFNYDTQEKFNKSSSANPQYRSLADEMAYTLREAAK